MSGRPAAFKKPRAQGAAKQGEDPTLALFEAMLRGDLQSLRQVLEESKPVPWRWADGGLGALQVAAVADADWPEVVPLLLAAGCPVPRAPPSAALAPPTLSPMQCLALGLSAQQFFALLAPKTYPGLGASQGGNELRPALDAAVAFGSLEAARALVAAGACRDSAFGALRELAEDNALLVGAMADALLSAPLASSTVIYEAHCAAVGLLFATPITHSHAGVLAGLSDRLLALHRSGQLSPAAGGPGVRQVVTRLMEPLRQAGRAAAEAAAAGVAGAAAPQVPTWVLETFSAWLDLPAALPLCLPLFQPQLGCPNNPAALAAQVGELGSRPLAALLRTVARCDGGLLPGCVGPSTVAALAGDGELANALLAELEDSGLVAVRRYEAVRALVRHSRPAPQHMAALRALLAGGPLALAAGEGDEQQQQQAAGDVLIHMLLSGQPQSWASQDFASAQVSRAHQLEALRAMEALVAAGCRPALRQPAAGAARGSAGASSGYSFDVAQQVASLELAGRSRWLWQAAVQAPWSPANHSSFPPDFQAALRTLLLCAANRGARSAATSLQHLPPELVHRIAGLAAYPLSAWELPPLVCSRRMPEVLPAAAGVQAAMEPAVESDSEEEGTSEEEVEEDGFGEEDDEEGWFSGDDYEWGPPAWQHQWGGGGEGSGEEEESSEEEEEEEGFSSDED